MATMNVRMRRKRWRKMIGPHEAKEKSARRSQREDAPLIGRVQETVQAVRGIE